MTSENDDAVLNTTGSILAMAARVVALRDYADQCLDQYRATGDEEYGREARAAQHRALELERAA